MNAKEQNIQRLYKARTTHLKWVNSLKLLVSGFDIDKKTLTPLLQDSEFGKWFYNEAMQFSQFNSKNVLEELETYLESMYDMYANIYAIYFGERSSIKNFLGFKSSTNKYEIELASRYYEDIVKLSDQFKNRFRLFESQLLALSNEKHEMVKPFDLEAKNKASNTIHDNDIDVHYHGPRSH